jgi:hypothetical protein
MSLKIWQEAAILPQRLSNRNRKLLPTDTFTPATDCSDVMATTPVFGATARITAPTNPSSVTMSLHLPEASGLR